MDTKHLVRERMIRRLKTAFIIDELASTLEKELCGQPITDTTLKHAQDLVKDRIKAVFVGVQPIISVLPDPENPNGIMITLDENGETND